eukprot:scaffold91_cov127-Cylindrotheca_fusiformis.AAC.39
MSMREDLRLDIRNGPPLSKVVSGSSEGFDGFLRGHASLLDVVRRTMNPKDDSLFHGNIGRYNFDGSGPDGSYQDLRVSQVGGIVSFPGAADQAIHADCPHLFEHIECLPAHYINIFAPGVAFDDKVGGTAFFHGSHNLRFTAQHCGPSDDYQQLYPFLVQSFISDCRTGQSLSKEFVSRHIRTITSAGSFCSTHKTSTATAVLYTNTTQKWYHDPKNFDDERSKLEWHVSSTGVECQAFRRNKQDSKKARFAKPLI